MLDSLRWALCEACGLEKPSGPPHLTLAYFHAPDGTPAPEELICAIGATGTGPSESLQSSTSI